MICFALDDFKANPSVLWKEPHAVSRSRQPPVCGERHHASTIGASHCPHPQIAVAYPAVWFSRVQVGGLRPDTLDELGTKRLHALKQSGAVLKRQLDCSLQNEGSHRIQVVPYDPAAEPNRLKRNASAARCR